MKNIKILGSVLMVVLMLVSMNGFAYASAQTGVPVIVQGISKVTVNASRTTSTQASVKASGPLTAKADSIKTTATLYEYNQSTGSLTATGTTVTKTSYNCTAYSFSTSFSINSAKKYKVKLEVTETTDGVSNKGVYYSSEF